MTELKRYKASEFMWNSDVYYIIEADSYIAHQKRKRCLAMAMWCDSEMNYWYDSTMREQRPRFKFYEKWHKRWIELADKFKEVK